MSSTGWPISTECAVDDESDSCDTHFFIGKANQRSALLNLANGAVIVVLYGKQWHEWKRAKTSVGKDSEQR